MGGNSIRDSFAKTVAKFKAKTFASRIALAALIILGLIATLVACGASAGHSEYNTVTVPSDRIGVSEIWRPNRNMFKSQYRYSLSFMGELRLELNRSQYQELREFLRREGGGGFWMVPQYVDGEIELVQHERSYVMVELRYRPYTERQANFRWGRPYMRYTGELLGFTPLFEDNTIVLPGDTINLTQIPVTFRQLGVHPFTYWLADGYELRMEISQAQHEELSEIIERGNIMIELHYRTHTGRLLNFTVLED
ncbi:MAG: hypothetical protein FWE19_05165 [Oscillospiraceae bacterium]|nr:hypothetical protein [Oscillospiraceae bacterium]